MSDLFRAADYAPIAAPDGLEGILEGIEDQPIDLVIHDIMMPKADGIGVLNVLKAIQPELPVILLSAKASAEDVLKGHSLGCDAYVTKPFDPDQLPAEVQRLLGARTSA